MLVFELLGKVCLGGRGFANLALKTRDRYGRGVRSLTQSYASKIKIESSCVSIILVDLWSIAQL